MKKHRAGRGGEQVQQGAWNDNLIEKPWPVGLTFLGDFDQVPASTTLPCPPPIFFFGSETESSLKCLRGLARPLP